METKTIFEEGNIMKFVKRTLNREDHSEIERQAAFIRAIIRILLILVGIFGWVLYLAK